MCKLRYTILCIIAVAAVCTAGAQENQDAGVTEPAAYTLDKVLDALKAPVEETFTGVLTEVTAGDLIAVQRGSGPVQLRLYGVDCPETGQTLADKARVEVVDRVLDTTVNVHILTEDSQALPVALVFDGTGNSLSHWLAAQGLAWWDDRNAPNDTLLKKLSAEAIVGQKNIFEDPAPLAPWDYRKSNELPDFEYTLKEPEPEPQPPTVSEPEASRSISAKGTMTENRPRPAAPAPTAAKSPEKVPSAGIPLSIPGLPADIAGDANIGDLLIKHQPRIATDTSGNPLGLTANDVASIPYASQYGFKEGDIISRVNGVSIESIPQIVGLYPRFKDVRNFQVEVLRNGQTVTIPINVK